MNNEIYGETLGKRLKNLRINNGLNQAELLSKIEFKIAQSNYVQYELDRIQKPNKKLVKALAEFYSVSIKDLTTPYDPLSHLPSNVKEMICDPEATFIMIKAVEEYKSYLAKKEALEV